MPKKKKQRAHQTSKGSGRSVAVKTPVTNPLQRAINQLEAFNKGKNVMLTIPNPNPNETNKRFIRVNARDVWGDWRVKSGKMAKGGTDG